MRTPWARAIWWCCVMFPLGAISFEGCGGRVLVAECGPNEQFCAKSVVCCPAWTVCGTGADTADGNGCPLKSCCGPPADAAPTADPWPTDEPVYPPSYTGNPSPHGGGVVPPQHQ